MPLIWLSAYLVAWFSPGPPLAAVVLPLAPFVTSLITRGLAQRVSFSLTVISVIMVGLAIGIYYYQFRHVYFEREGVRVVGFGLQAEAAKRAFEGMKIQHEQLKIKQQLREKFQCI